MRLLRKIYLSTQALTKIMEELSFNPSPQTFIEYMLTEALKQQGMSSTPRPKHHGMNGNSNY